MRDKVKYNIANVVPSPDDIDWANKFLYPDLREPYRLLPNKSGHKTAVELLAAGRAAERLAREDVKENNMSKQKEVDKAFDESSKATDEMFGMIDKVFAPFKKFGAGTFTRIKK